MQRIQHDSNRIIVALFIGIFCVVLLRTAWVSDDAYITLRTVDNFVNGYGLTWNIAERVQAYTHPLWMFVLSGVYFITHEAFFSTIAVSIVFSLAALVILNRTIARSLPGALLGITILIFSRAYIDYSTSGLENPLTHLLLVLFFALYLTREWCFRTLVLLALIAALGMLNRMDILLLFAPTLAYASFRLFPMLKQRTGYALALGFVPFVLWELFALWYYGFLFPNTAYAKLNTGMERAVLVEQGMYYLIDSLSFDPITLLAIGCGIALPFFTRQRHTLPIVLGIVLYLIYVVYIGGDFMRGRFLAAPLLCAVIIITFHFTTHALTRVAPVLVVIALIALLPDYHSSNFLARHGIADERANYYYSSGLFNVQRLRDMPRSDTETIRDLLAQQFSMESVATVSTIGLIGFRAGPEVHIIDTAALADPLLARLPAIRYVSWRPGHFYRRVPDGYANTLKTGENMIEDEQLARYYNHLAYVTRGPLFDIRRLQAIWHINSGAYDQLINFDAYRYPTMVRVHVSEIQGGQQAPRTLTDSGIEIDFEGQQHQPHLEIELSQDDDYQLVYFNGATEVGRQDIEASQLAPHPLALYVRDVPAEAIATGYTRLRVVPLLHRGDPWRIGAVRLLESRDEMTPHMVLGTGWELAAGGIRWASSPAHVHLFSPQQQSALMEITVAQIYEPGSAAVPPLGDQGVLDIYADQVLLDSVPITASTSSSLRLLLPEGHETLIFDLKAGNFVMENQTRSFAITQIDLRTE
jgi:arabinofuranosyltransferase